MYTAHANLCQIFVLHSRIHIILCQIDFDENNRDENFLEQAKSGENGDIVKFFLSVSFHFAFAFIFNHSVCIFRLICICMCILVSRLEPRREQDGFCEAADERLEGFSR